MASLDHWIKSLLFFMPLGHFTRHQMYGHKIDDHKLFFPQTYETEVNYCPSLDMSANYLSDQGHTPGIWDKGYTFRLIENRSRSQSPTLTA